MSFGTVSTEVWQPLPDDRLSWFRAEERIFAAPRPLDYSMEVHSIVFGLTYALESVEFPLYAVRSRLHHGRVYLAAVPSAMAENNLPQRLANIHDQSLRYTKNLRRAWAGQLKPEIERYNRWFEENASFTGSDGACADLVRQLRRARGNQWFVAIRGVLVPNLLLRQNSAEVGAKIIDTAQTLTNEAMALVKKRGGELLAAMLATVGARLVDRGVIETCDDVSWLDWLEIRERLQSPADCSALIGQRRLDAIHDRSVAVPATLGPELAADAPRMYLLREVLALLDH